MRTSVATMMGFAAVLALLTTSADAAQPRKYRRHAAGPSTVAVAPLQRGANLFPPGPVYYGGPGVEYLGTDPDPFIRQQLLRDLTAHFGGAF
jgi:hypothetical protein